MAPIESSESPVPGRLKRAVSNTPPTAPPTYKPVQFTAATGVMTLAGGALVGIRSAADAIWAKLVPARAIAAKPKIRTRRSMFIPNRFASPEYFGNARTDTQPVILAGHRKKHSLRRKNPLSDFIARTGGSPSLNRKQSPTVTFTLHPVPRPIVPHPPRRPVMVGSGVFGYNCGPCPIMNFSA
jgi:hypothetical protein